MLVRKQTIRRASRALTLACDKEDGSVVAKAFQLGWLSPAAVLVESQGRNISLPVAHNSPVHRVLLDSVQSIHRAEVSRPSLAHLMREGLRAIEIAFMFNRSPEGLMGQACPERSEGTLPRGRDARTGQFTTVEEAQQHPSTHVVERVPKPGYGDRKGN